MGTRYDNLVAVTTARAAEWMAARPDAPGHFLRIREYRKELRRFKRELLANTAALRSVSPDLAATASILKQSIENALWVLNSIGSLPRGLAEDSTYEPRILAIASQIVATVPEFITTTECFLYLNTVQQHVPLSFAEISLFIPTIRLVLLLELARLHAQWSSGLQVATGFFERRLHNYFRTEYSTQDWESFVGCVVPFEQVLEADPSQTYQQMDEFSKTLYRAGIAKLARRLGREEWYVAHQALALAQRAKEREASAMPHKTHVGYYIIDEGALELEALLRTGRFQSLIAAALRGLRSFSFFAMAQEALAFILAVTILAITGHSLHGWPASLILLFAFQILCWQAVQEIVNFLLSLAVPVRTLPRIDLTLGPSRPPDTAVVIPVLLVSEVQVRQLFQSVEAQFLQDRSLAVHWVFLTDLPDSLTPPTEEQSHALHKLCVQLAGGLNAKYQPSTSDHFFVLGRRREFNPAQGVWMGWERKRGKLENFYDFLRKGRDPFLVKAGNVGELKNIKYFVVLDEDSQLLEGVLGKLIGTIMHPLNSPIVPTGWGRVSRGYGIIEPALRPSPSRKSFFSKLLTWQQDTLPYDYPTPSPLQDAFGETAFMGKGIYSIAAYGEVLNQRLPENAVLSHDVIDGAYMRTGLASDIKLREGMPESYSLYSGRGHRWIRGDWQNIAWLLPSETDDRRPRTLDLIYRWVIFQNLKRSVREIAFVVVLAVSWLWPHENNKLYIWVLLTLLAAPAYFVWLVSTLLVFYKYRTYRSWFAYFANRNVLTLWGIFLRQCLQISFLAHQALVAFDAICRTLLRLLTRKKLLEWASMRQTEADRKKLSIVDLYLQIIPIFSVAVLVAIRLFQPASFWFSVPFALLWALSLPLSTWISTQDQ